MLPGLDPADFWRKMQDEFMQGFIEDIPPRFLRIGIISQLMDHSGWFFIMYDKSQPVIAFC